MACSILLLFCLLLYLRSIQLFTIEFCCTLTFQKHIYKREVINIAQKHFSPYSCWIQIVTRVGIELRKRWLKQMTYLHNNYVPEPKSATLQNFFLQLLNHKFLNKIQSFFFKLKLLLKIGFTYIKLKISPKKNTEIFFTGMLYLHFIVRSLTLCCVWCRLQQTSSVPYQPCVVTYLFWILVNYDNVHPPSMC